jgi:hypothetical protein
VFHIGLWEQEHLMTAEQLDSACERIDELNEKARATQP